MALAKQPITFRFGPVDTETGDKHLRPGLLTLAQNCRQLKKYDFSPRKGFSRTAFSAVSGSFTGPPDSYVYTDTHLMRDAAGVNWAYDTGAAAWRSMGTVERPFPTSTIAVEPNRPVAPQMVRVGNYEWYLWIKNGGGAFGYSIRDVTTGRLILAPFEDAVTTNITAIAACSDGTDVYVLIANGSTSVAVRKFNPDATSVTSGTYQTIATAQIREVDCAVLASGEIAAVCAGSTGAAFHFSHSYVDKTLLTPKASPAAVTTTGAADKVCGGLSLLTGADGSNGKFYYSLWQPSGATDQLLKLIEVNTTTLAINSSTTLATRVGDAATPSFATGSCGHLADNGNRVVVAHCHFDEAALGFGTDARKVVTRQYTYDGSSTTSSVLGRSCWVASKPFKVGSSWYVITSTTNDFGTRDAGNGYHLRKLGASTGHVLAQMEYPLAPHNWQGVSVQNVHAVIVSGTDAYLALMSDGRVVRERINFAETYGPGVALRDKMVVPGPIPYKFGVADAVQELSPLTIPMTAEGNVAAGSDRFVQIVYRFADSKGVFDRSSPGASVGFAVGLTSLTVPTLRHTLGGAKALIEVYITDSGATTPVLKYVRENDYTADSITVAISSSDFVDPEAVYTSGGALAAAPPPACRNAVVHRNRLILSGTPRLGQIMPSLEMTEFEGPRFNSILASYWRDTPTDILRLEPISWTDCAVFSAGRVGVISGNGPNGKGQGPYVVQTIPEARGIKNAKAARQGSKGCIFQGDDSLYYFIGGLQLESLAAGADAFTSPVSASLHNPTDQEVRFYLEDGKILVFDYQFPAAEQPRGQWYAWSSAGLTRAYGAAMVSGEPTHMDTDGARRAPQATFSDVIAAGGNAAYDMVLASGETALFDLGRQFRLAEAIVHGAFVAATSLTFKVEMDWGGSTLRSWTQTRTIAAAPLQRMFKPAGGGRIQSVKHTITVPAAGGGATVSGLTYIVQDRGRSKMANTGQRALG